MRLRETVIVCLLFFFVFPTHNVLASDAVEIDISQLTLSPPTRTCIGCHSNVTPGIVKDWLTSRHAYTIPAEALKKGSLEKRISAETLPNELQKNVVGCYECHSMNSENHKDNFEHMGRRINVVVSPNDCKTCHPVEVAQFSVSKKSYAYKNLMENPVYHTLVSTITGMKKIEDNKIISENPSAATLQETCLGCHGTRIEVRGKKNIDTQLGIIEIPDLSNWSNQGVGRENPDGSRGACTACHPRHGFSIEVARKPYTCAQCHLDPDVPAWNIYRESKHGNIYSSKYNEWNFDSVPWNLGIDFKAPTCATCHNSLIISPTGEVIADRTHNFGARLWVRLFGLIYSHPQPIQGDTTIIKNKDGLPLPNTFLNEPASEYLIDKIEQSRRLSLMSTICKSCHGSNWVNSHFEKLNNTIDETNAFTYSATKLMLKVWEQKIEDKSNPFNESIEQMWIRQWLFYSNSIRYASAMTGAPDYASFKNGWWYLSETLQHMKNWMEFKKEKNDED